MKQKCDGNLDKMSKLCISQSLETSNSNYKFRGVYDFSHKFNTQNFPKLI